MWMYCRAMWIPTFQMWINADILWVRKMEIYVHSWINTNYMWTALHWPFQGGTSFVDLLCFCSVLCLLCLCARLIICALWSPAGKGLTSWLSFVVSTVSLSLSHWYPGSGVVLDCIDSWSLHTYFIQFIIAKEMLESLILVINVKRYYCYNKPKREFCHKARKTPRVRNRYNQVPHLNQDTKWESNKITIIQAHLRTISLSLC